MLALLVPGAMKDRTVRTNRASLTPSPAVMHSGSEVVNDTTCCVLLAWLTTVPPRVTAIPDTERLLLASSAKSASAHR